MKKILSVMISLIMCLGIPVFCACDGGGGGGAEENLLVRLSFEDGDEYYAVNSVDGKKYAVENVFNSAAYKTSRPAYRTAGVSGKALSFDGYSNYIELGDALKGHYEFSVTAWIALRCFDFADGNINPIAEYYSISGDSGFIFGYSDYGKWGLRIKLADKGWVECFSSERLELYNWYNLGFTFDGKNVKLYINGKLSSEKEVSALDNGFISASDYNFALGRNSFKQTGTLMSYNGFAGIMDEYKIYDCCLSPERIAEQYNRFAESGHPVCGYENLAYPADYLADDVNRMSYHAAPYINWISDMCGGFYFNGKYHIFYQKNDTGPYFRSFSWGHMVSDDMTVWKEIQPAIYPTENYLDNIFTFSGCAVVDGLGVPYIVYTGISTVGDLCSLSMATPEDLSDPELTNWKKTDVELKLPSSYNKEQFRDPYVYTENGKAYLIAVSQTASGNPCIVGWTADTDNITDWKFAGTVFEKSKTNPGISGTMWELPQLYKLKGENGESKYMFTMTPVPQNGTVNNCMYWLGEFDLQNFRFTPEQSEATLLDEGNNYMCAGSGFADPVSGKVISFALAKCAEHTTVAKIGASGWAGTVTLLREYSLNSDGTLCIKPYSGYERLHSEHLAEIKDKQASKIDLSGVSGRAVHIKMTIKPVSGEKCGIRFLSNGARQYAEFYYDADGKRFCLNTVFAGDTAEKGYKYLAYEAEEEVGAEIFIDKSSVEIFIGGRYAMSSRLYLSEECDKFAVIGQNWYAKELDIYSMQNCFGLLAADKT